MPDSVNSLKNSNGELKKQLEEAKKELKMLEQRVTDQECIVRNVNSESSASAILNREGEASLEFIDQEFDGTKLQERLPSLHDIDLFSLNLDEKSDSELSPFHPIRCKYHSPHGFYQFKDKFSRQSNSKQFSLMHSNIRSLKHNLANFQTHLLNELNYRA